MIHDLAQFGAVGDGKTLNTEAIQCGIDWIADRGGGTLEIPEGVFVSGAIFLKPEVNLHMAEGAVLQCSPDPTDFPRRRTRIEGHYEESFNVALINADECDGLRIWGKGTLDGVGEQVWDTFWRNLTHDPDFRNLDLDRARLCLIENSENVSVSGITFKDSQFWNLHLYNCRNVTVEESHFMVPETYWKPPSTDGIDVDSCQDVEIQGCSFSISDDCICLKGTKGPDAMLDSDSPPVERIRVSNCEFMRGCGAVTCGSEATVVRDVMVENCKVTGLMPLARFKLRPDTPQRYEDIHFSNISMEAGGGEIIQVRGWTQYYDPQGKPEPESTVRNITISNVTGSVYSLGEITGNRESRIREIRIENVNVVARRAGLQAGSEPSVIILKNVTVNGKPYG